MSEVQSGDVSYIGNPSEDEVRRKDRAHVFHTWAAQAEIDPLPIAGAKGAYFWDHDGNKYLDFASQLVNMNIGHQHPKLVAAIQKQAETLCYISPKFANAARSEAAYQVTQVAPGNLNKVFFTNGGADANEHAMRFAQQHTGRRKILAFYRSYHGATSGALSLTGEPRRWGAESSASDAIHFWGPYAYRSAFHARDEAEECERALKHLRDVVSVEGPHTIAGIIMETVVGTNGILVPPDGYLAGVREICDEHGIMMISDEVMAGFGRCGEWFAVNHWNVVPDLLTFAKGSNSGYVPIGGVVMSDDIARTFDHRPYPGGLTYSGHLLGCASIVASINIFREEKVVEHARHLGEEVIGPELKKLAERHPSIGNIRGLGVFWALELVRDRETREPLVPFNAKGEAAKPMQAFEAACKKEGLWPFIHFNGTHVAPPCTTSEDTVREGLAMLDRALDVADGYYTGKQ